MAGGERDDFIAQQKPATLAGCAGCNRHSVGRVGLQRIWRSPERRRAIPAQGAAERRRDADALGD